MPAQFLLSSVACRCLWIAALLAVAMTLPSSSFAAEERTGEVIYKQFCAKCHGAGGDGENDHYPNPLVGERSVGELAEYIDKTMPEKEPEKLNAADSRLVAAFIHEAFYSPVAQARLKPARIELSRLTVRQYRQSISDLVGSFRGGAGRWGPERGLKGEYFKSRNFSGKEKFLDRVDPVVRFDFGTNSPVPETVEGHQFSIRWEGSVLAPETGEYEFIVRTEHAARLYLNGNTLPLVDAWVKSGKDIEFRQSITLLGGRAYPLRLEFSKAKQGVDDTQKEKERPSLPASISLSWKRPQLVEEVIPARLLSTARNPESFVIETAFPPDDRSIGYERGTSISKAWDQATTDSAITVASFVASKINEFAGTKSDAADRDAKLREFCSRFVARAFRRPLTDEQRQLYVTQQFEKAADPETAVKRVVLLALKSPRFLYRELDGEGEGEAPAEPNLKSGSSDVRGSAGASPSRQASSRAADNYAVASRLSFGLWDSIPDQVLLDAASRGQLATREQVAQQANRMLADQRTQSKLREFLLQWLKVDQPPDVSKDSARFPEFNAAVAADLRTSLELFIDDVLGSEASDFRELLLADSLYLNGRLAKFYGADLPEDAAFQKVSIEPGERAGVLSHPYLMAGFAYTATSSPIHRGVFISRSLLGRSLRTPPIAVAPLAPDLHASLTTRERVALQTKAESCQSCHSLINPLGFTLEHFDAVGRFRRDEQSKPVDSTGAYRTRSGETVTFNGVRDLATFLAESNETHSAFVEQLFHYLVKQPVRAYGPQTLAELKQAFVRNKFSIRREVVEIVTTAALTGSAAKADK